MVTDEKWVYCHHSPSFKTNNKHSWSRLQKASEWLEAGAGLILAATVAPLNFPLVYLLLFRLTSLSVLSLFLHTWAKLQIGNRQDCTQLSILLRLTVDNFILQKASRTQPDEIKHV